MKKCIFLILSAAILILGFNSCKPTDLTPAYIHITPEDLFDCIDVSNFNETHDENFDQDKLDALKRHEFTHVNVYVNNKNLGCWELPCKVPVLDVNDNDTCQLVLIPAFPLTGMSNTITGYPFLNITRQKIVLQKGQVYEVSKNRPKYVYSEYAVFPFFETLSNSSPFTPTSGSPDQTNLTFVPTTVDGFNVGEIILSDSNGLHFDVETKAFPVNVGSYRTLLEIRYKTEGNVDVNMRMSSATNSHIEYPVGGFYASPDKWKTIHFELTNIINNNHSTGGISTNLTLVLSGGGEAGKETHFAIDDIKVIYIRTA